MRKGKFKPDSSSLEKRRKEAEERRLRENEGRAWIRTNLFLST